MVQEVQSVRVIGRYALYNPIAAGGMATVHLGRLLGPVGFSRTVAIKRLHAQFATDPEFVSMFLDEARLAARIRHPNVVPTLDVVATGGELFLVMDYVPGESVARLSRALRERQQKIPLRVLSTIMAGLLHGLHAAHEAKDERGHPLGIVHRDVSPQNVLVGTDGVPRVLDFGVAKAAGRMQTTKEGQIKGKLSYMPPEQLKGAAVSRQTDIYAAGVMLWELLTGQRLFAAENEGAIVARVLEGRVEPPSYVLARARWPTDPAIRQQLGQLDRTVLRAVAMNPAERFSTAREMALEIERTVPPATASDVGDWVEGVARDVLHSRAALIAEIEGSSGIVPDGNHLMSVLHANDARGLNEPSLPMAALPPQAGLRSYVGPVDGPPVTQPSSISVSSARHEDAGKKAGAAVAVGLFVGLMFVVTGLAWRYASTLRPSAGAAPSASTSSVPESPTATAPEPAKSLATSAPAAPRSNEEDAGLAPEPSATGAAAHASATKPAIPKPAVQPVRPAVAPKPSAQQPPAPDCSTPFWFDAQGVKHYKPDCVK